MSEYRPDFVIPTDLPEALPILPLRSGVLLPGNVRPYTVGRGLSHAALDAAVKNLVLVAVQREPVTDPAPADLLPVAVLARVVERRKMDGGPEIVVVQGLSRVKLGEFTKVRPNLAATFTLVSNEWPEGPEAEAMAKTIKETATEIAERVGIETQILERFENPSLLVDAIASMIQLPDGWPREVLLALDPVARGELVLAKMVHLREVFDAQKSIKDRIDSETKDAVLRRQLDAIQKELGEGETDELKELKNRIPWDRLPDDVRNSVERELKRLDRINSASPERSVAVDWLEWIADLPWKKFTAQEVSFDSLEKALEATHYGLEDVKRQVLEHLSVRKLAGSGRADVLLLVGPPGVGKTSIGSAIAEATNRKLVRVALGAMRDEAELRGHRRTYIGARPGRLIEGIRRAGAQDPVVLLDEVDKMGSGYRGDPAAALLEILDPEQNHAFVDHYLEVPFDLSKVLFIATANDLANVPEPLRDRMEVLEIAGYTREDKIVIAQRHLVKKLAENVGLKEGDVVITDDALREAIAGWTREEGVRQLQRTLGRIWRAAAVKKAKDELNEPLVVDAKDLATYLGRRKVHDEAHEVLSRPGIARGLAWTPVGGDVLYVEASTLPGKGQLILTGQLGEVMKESARAALTFTMANASALGIPHDVMEDRDLHVHVPAGAVPKDGPSAGVTMFMAIASLLSGRPVRDDVAMTGEATLRGRVLPVGGIKAKVLAAHRHGVKRVVLPKGNEYDIEDVPKEARDELEFILVDDMRAALEAALVPMSEQRHQLAV
jgi:ATP-dependent Lon protease